MFGLIFLQLQFVLEETYLKSQNPYTRRNGVIRGKREVQYLTGADVEEDIKKRMMASSRPNGEHFCFIFDALFSLLVSN